MVQITREVLEGMVEHAREAAPLECCGLLVGRTERVDERIACTNEAQSRVSFSIPPLELLDLFRTLRQEGKRLLGIYHSHPGGPAVPSRRDVAEFAYPDASYWIVSLQRPEPVVRCFSWTGSSFRPVPFGSMACLERVAEGGRQRQRGELR